MLHEIAVENLAIIDQATVSLSTGFTALTGETGAGKSLFIDAIDLVLGGRADSTLVRAGALKAVVTLVVDVASNESSQLACTEAGVEPEDGLIVLRREVSPDGRSVARINGSPVTAGQLRRLGDGLVDLHGQHDHQALLSTERQADFLDAWIGAEAAACLEKVQSEYELLQSSRQRLAALSQGQKDRHQRIDMLSFQVDEIENVNPLVNESDELQVQIERLKHVSRLQEGAARIVNHLVEDDASAESAVGSCLRELGAMSALDPTLESLHETLASAQAQLSEAGREARAYLDRLDSHPTTLERAAARLDSLKRLQKKYGDTDEAVLQHLDSAKAELANLTGGGGDLESLRAQVLDQEAKLMSACQALTHVRTKKSAEFAAAVTSGIRELAMERAAFEVRIVPKPPAADGADDLSFQFSANQGEPLKPLSKVASGGELSRLMLATKVAGAGKGGVPTIIFDEVDTGLSGKAAAVTAKMLERLADHTQVIVISHLPQIAARAHTHFRIEKCVEGDRTVTRIHKLEQEARLEEIARMLAGESIGESALANARELVCG